MTSEHFRRRIEQLLDQADEAVAKFDWDLVRNSANAVLALDPENQDAAGFLSAPDRASGASTGLSAAASPLASPPSQQPAAFANGRYVATRYLGEGGKKRVLLAKDARLDRNVAFALIKTEGLDEVSRVRVQREAEGMGRLGAHPHVVTVFDIGEENG